MSNSKFCIRCTEQLSVDDQFCPICGLKVEHTDVNEGETLTQPAREQPHRAIVQIPNRKKLLVGGIVVAAVLLVLIVAISLVANPMNRFKASIGKDNYREALAIYQDDIAGNAQDELHAASAVVRRVEEVREKYMQENLTYESAMASLDAMMETGLAFESVLAVVDEIFEMNQSRTAFNTAERLLEAKDYAGAITSYRMVILADKNYDAAQSQLTAAADALRAAAIEQSTEMSTGKSYTQAIAVLESALKVLPDDSKLVEELASCKSAEKAERKAGILSGAQASVENGDYAGAFVALEDGMLEFADDADMKIALEQYRQQCVDEAVARAKKMFSETRNYESAWSIINGALLLLPEDKILIEQLAHYASYRPVWLFDLEPFTNGFKGSSPWKETDSDNVGNTYKSGLKITNAYASIMGQRTAAASREYLLNGAYDKLYGYFVVHKNSKNATKESCYARLTVYGDGKVLYESSTIRGGVEPVHVDIRLTGVRTLKISMDYNPDYTFGLVDMLLERNTGSTGQ